MPVNTATQGIDYMNKKQLKQLARIYGVLHDNTTDKATLATAIKAK